MADQTLAKFVNELRILTMLRTQGAASRADIARRLALTPGTITRLIANLSQRDLVHEIRGGPQSEAVREPGRPGVSIAINPDGAYFFGAEIGVGVLRLALIDLSAKVVNSAEIRVSRDLTPEDATRAIADHLAVIQHDIRFRGKVHSAGVTAPGLVTLDGYVVNLPILGWRDVRLLDHLNAALDLPCFVENNANAAAFGAFYTQPSMPSVSTIFLKIGTGCGGAAIINGRLLRGAQGTAGEMGHIRISDHGPRCSCGQSGCLESEVNLGALARLYNGDDAFDESELSALPALVAGAFERGHPDALRSVQSIGRHLGIGIVSLVNIFNPTAVILGGIMRPVLERCLEQIRSQVAEAIVPGVTAPDVRMSHLGDFECAIGAATIAHHHAFDISNFDVLSQEVGMEATR